MSLMVDKYPQGDFFICDFFGAAPKDDLISMEHPLFSLSTRPDLRVLKYAHNDVEITVTPSVRGLATIYDKDIIIYCVSQLVAAINAGSKVSRTLKLRAHDLLVATNRDTSGDSYKRLIEAFERLAGTRIMTNIVTGGLETTRGFGLIEEWEVVRQTRAGRMVSVSVKLSEWLYRAILSRSVLTLSRDYFRLRKPLERRVYELSRKHCGKQSEWSIKLTTLHKKSGSSSPLRVFRKMIRDMVSVNHLPGYVLSLDDKDLFTVKPIKKKNYNSSLSGDDGSVTGDLPPLDESTISRAKTLAPGYDVYALEAEWRAHWIRSGRIRLLSPSGAFIGFIKKKVNSS